MPGDLIETGVWRGGATIFMRAMLKARGVTDRTVWVADSFEGLPEPDAEKYPIEGAGVLTSLTRTDGLVELPEHCTVVAPGDEVGFIDYALIR